MSIFELTFYNMDTDEEFTKAIEVEAQLFSGEFKQSQEALRQAYRYVRENKNISFFH